MRPLKFSQEVHEVLLTAHGMDYSLSRVRPPSGKDVELTDVTAKGISIYAVLDPEVRCQLADQMLKNAVDDWCADAEEAADARREENLCQG